MYLLRPVKKQDLDDLVELAQFLDTVNFPNDREKIEQGINLSINSFSKNLKNPKEAVYQFVLEEEQEGRVMGVSKIIAHHGTPEEPHYYWQISYDRRESKTIGIALTHQVLKLGKDHQGHTEIAGIVIHPKFQGKHLGKQLFYVRFLYMALHRNDFLNRVISELLPPLDEEGKSVLWEVYGLKFTGLSYQEADRLSHDNKEFIETLFPQHKIYTCLLPAEAREVIGKVGSKSLPVKGLAEKNGFQFLEQIDPFDGGPHYGCETAQITALKNTLTAPVKIVANGLKEKGVLGLVGKTAAKGLEFRALERRIWLKSPKDKELFITPEIQKALKIEEGELISFLPYT